MLTDAEIEAALADDLPEQIAAEIRAAHWPRNDGAELILPLIIAIREIVTRLRAAGIGDASLRNALIHGPRRARAHYQELARLNRRLDTVKGDPELAREARIAIAMHKASLW